MVTIQTCNEYLTLRTLMDWEAAELDLPKLCRDLEIANDDGFAVCAWQEGRIIADAEGYVAPDLGPADPILAAYERRFDD